MSRRIAKKKQSGGKHSDYQTPHWCISSLLETEPDFLTPDIKTIYEPNAGKGRVLEAFIDEGFPGRTIACEIQDRYEPYLYDLADVVNIGSCFDFDAGPVDLAISNPAFPIAMELIEHLWSSVKHICLLLPTTFIGSDGRADFLWEHMPDTYDIPNRPSFTDDGRTDQATYAWYHWDTKAVREPGEPGRRFMLDRVRKDRRYVESRHAIRLHLEHLFV